MLLRTASCADLDGYRKCENANVGNIWIEAGVNGVEEHGLLLKRSSHARGPRKRSVVLSATGATSLSFWRPHRQHTKCLPTRLQRQTERLSKYHMGVGEADSTDSEPADRELAVDRLSRFDKVATVCKKAVVTQIVALSTRQ